MGKKRAKPIWWEKTVEYHFVATMAEHDKLALAPLAGKHERASDLIAACPKGMILIEFKRDKKSLGTEKSKFKDYKNAKKELKGQDNHHFLIYGASTRKGWTLVAKNYFSPGSKDVHNLDTLIDKGAPYEPFLLYVERFIAHKLVKKGNDNDQGGGGSWGGKPPDNGPSGNPPLDYSIVAGVSKDGKIVQCMTLDDFMMRADGPSDGGGPLPNSMGPSSEGERKTISDELVPAVATKKVKEKEFAGV